MVGDQPPGGFRAEGIEDLVHGGALLGPGRIGEIHHNQQAVGLQGLFQGGAKRLHQGWGQVADEPHGVGEQQRHAAAPFWIGNLQAPGGGIEGGEQFVFSQHGVAARGLGEGIEQGTLAGIGVAHQGQPFQAGAALPEAGPMLTQGFDLFVEPFDAPGNGPPVFFQLGLTGAPGADATALARQAEAAPAEAGQAVAHLGQFHLQATRGAGGSLGKDVEDQFAPVAHGEVEEPLQVAGLNGGELPIGHHQGGPNPAGFQGGFGHLALPPDGLGGHLGAALLHHADGDAPGAAHQPFEFADQALGCAPIAGGEGEEQHLVLAGGHQVGGSGCGRAPLGDGQAGWIRGTEIPQITFEL